MPNLDTLLSFPSNSGAGPSSAVERTPIPPCSCHILVTDTIDSPGLFVLTHFLRAANAIKKSRRTPSINAERNGKARAHTKVIWLGCNSDGSVHLKNVARKSAVHLDEEIRNGAFCWIDANAEAVTSSNGPGLANAVAGLQIEDGTSAAEQVLRRLYGKVAAQLQGTSRSDIDDNSEADWTSRKLVVIDDLTALAWSLDPFDSSGQPVDGARLLSAWVSALTSLATKVCTSSRLEHCRT